MSDVPNGSDFIKVLVLGQWVKATYDSSGQLVTITCFNIEDVEKFKKHIVPTLESFETKIRLCYDLIKNCNFQSLRQINEAFDNQFEEQLELLVPDIGE